MSTTQKVIKYMAIVFGIILIIAIFSGICRILFGMGGFYMSKPSNSGLNIDEYKEDAKILNIDLAAADLVIKSGDTLKVSTKNKYVKTKVKNNKLSVVETSHFFVKINKKDRVIVYVPEDLVFDDSYISSGAGVIDINKLKTDSLKLNLGAGKLTMNNISVFKKTSIEGGAGKVVANNSVFNNLKLEAGVGKFLINAKLKGSADIKAGVGDFTLNLLDSKDNYKITAEAGIGSLKIADYKVGSSKTYGNGSNKIKLEGGIGSIKVDFKN